MMTGAERSRLWRERHPGENAAQQRAYAERHPGTHETRNVRRDQVVRDVVYTRDEGRCQVRLGDDNDPCRGKVDPDNWELDHILPRIYGGDDSVHNLRVAHPMCNRRRRRSLTEDDLNWIASDILANERAA